MRIYLILENEKDEGEIDKLAILEVEEKEAGLVYRSVLEILARSGLPFTMDSE